MANSKLSAEERWEKLREHLKEYKRVSRERILTADEKTFLYNLIEANAYDKVLDLMTLVENSEWQQD